MKLIDHKIVWRQTVVSVSPGTREDYEVGLRQKPGSIREWVRWDDMPNYVQAEAQHPRRVFCFEFCILSYLPAAKSPRRGMDRRHGLKVLRDMGLIAPTASQVLAVATDSLYSGQMLRVSKVNHGRKIACLVPFCPENPDYYYFGCGMEGRGSFRRVNYETVSGEGNLYFWYHDHARDQGNKIYPNPRHFEYHFPLLLGVSRTT